MVGAFREPSCGRRTQPIHSIPYSVAQPLERGSNNYYSIIQGECTMIVRKEINLTQPLAPSQVEMLHNLESRPISPDENCPELTMDQLAQFRRISAANREERCKQTVTLRLSPQALRRAKSLGKGYTSVLSRILESALENPDIVRHHL